MYGEVSLEAGNILRFAKAAPFQGRLAALREVSGDFVVSTPDLSKWGTCVTDKNLSISYTMYFLIFTTNINVWSSTVIAMVPRNSGRSWWWWWWGW